MFPLPHPTIPNANFFNRKALVSNIVGWMVKFAGSASILIVLLIFLFIGKEAIPFLGSSESSTLLSTGWVPTSMQQELFGLLPLLNGTLIVTAIAALVTVPCSVLTAVYLAELANEAEKNFLKPLIELLAGIPSVVIGFFGLVVVAPMIKDLFQLSSGLVALTGGLLLALMAAPTIISIAEDALRNVPQRYKDASAALGASHVETITTVTVPAALPGIIAAVMLGIGRVVGETMAVLMVTGNAAILTASPFEPVRTMTATIAAEMGEVAFGSTHYSALFVVGIVLLTLTFGLNAISQVILQRYKMG